MAAYGHNSRAFDNWYAEGDDESLAEYERQVKASDAMSRFKLEIGNAIVSDDAVDAELWLSIRGMTPTDLNWEIPQA